MSLLSVLCSAENYNLFSMCLALIALFLPISLSYRLESLQKSPVCTSILSSEAQFSYGVLMMSTIPLVLDTLLDYNQIFDTQWKSYIFGRVPIVLTTFLIAVQYSVITTTPSIFGLTTNRAETYQLCVYSFKIVVTSALMYILSNVKPSVLTGWTTSLFSFTVCITSVVRVYTPGSTPTFHYMSDRMSDVCLIILLTLLGYWSSKLAKVAQCTSVEDYTCMLYIFIYFVVMIANYSHAFRSWHNGTKVSDFSQFTPDILTVLNYSYIPLNILFTIAPGRIARFESVVHLVSYTYTDTSLLYVGCMHTYIRYVSPFIPYVFWYICIQRKIIDMKKAYVRFISHELRTPLNSVFMGMQLSIDQIPEDTQEPVEVERRETLVETQSACCAALDILNELLLFDKLEDGVLVMNKLTVPVPELVEDSIKMFSVQAREKSLELVITNNDESMLVLNMSGPAVRSVVDSINDMRLLSKIFSTDQVYVDKNKVVQVIRNVVSNAIKFTPAFGKIQLNVRFVPALLVVKGYQVSTKTLTTGTGEVDAFAGAVGVGDNVQIAGELVIEIKDTGAGISEENQKRLFKEVVQFNPELLQNGGGSGLGMCISKGIMDGHGGSISVYSAGEGQGSVFTLRLPMIRSQSTTPPVYVPAPASPIRRSPSPSLSRVRSTTQFSLHTVSNESLDGLSITESEDASHASELTLGPFSPSTKALSSKSFKSVCSSVPERPLRFLVVDDSSLNRKMLCRLLRNKGHECVEAEDGAQAVAMMTTALAMQSARGPPQLSDRRETESDKMSVNTGTESSKYDVVLMDFM